MRETNSKKQLKKGFVAKTTAAFSFLEGGPTKRKSTNDDKHGQGQEKRRPTTFSWGKQLKKTA